MSCNLNCVDRAKATNKKITPTDPDPAAAKCVFGAMMQMKKIEIAVIEAAHRG